ncbi:MAG: [FeFe] hydrogenase H-cluster radical SAM maturase HydE [Deltaproteobacteria bacterium]|nr:[FeFe] hydrogenase H-cluster radical SAM maturase HydE [Deltaproteobacteria bacterium]
MLTKRQIVDFLEEKDEVVIEALFRQADQVRKKYVGDAVHLRGLIEFSNYCKRDCLYCGLRRSNENVVRYRMTIPEIFNTALEARNLGLQTVVLQSGEDPHFTIDDLCSLVRSIKTDIGFAVTLSIGERTYEDYKRLKDAGADRYLLRFETTDPVLFKKLKPDSVYEKRFRCLEWLAELGYQVGSGIMVGLPGQTMESIADDVLKFKEIDLDMVGLGPYISHPNTPLQGSENGTLDMVLRVTALTRIVTKNAHMPATTATGTIDAEGRQKALQCGANVLMPNSTPRKYREHYLIYLDKICIDEEPHKCRFCVESMVIGLGRTISSDAGHSLKSASC